MSVNTKLSILALIYILLAGCSAQRNSTPQNRLLTPTSSISLVKNTSTPTPDCFDESGLLSSESKVALLELLKTPLEFGGGPDWFSSQGEKNLYFYVRGIYAIDTDIVFLFGGLEVLGGSTIRSMLLRSTDGGNHWKEVMTPIGFSDITHIAFIGNGEGWAVSTWTLEGELGIRIWHTMNYGETWQEIKGDPLPVLAITGIKIFDSQHIEIKSLYWWGGITDRYMVMNSYDGGKTWSESYQVPVDSENLFAIVEAFADTPGGHYGSYYDCNLWESVCIVYGQDGSKWQYQDNRGKICPDKNNSDYYNDMKYGEVRHIWLKNESLVKIPLYFEYRENEVHVKP